MNKLNGMMKLKDSKPSRDDLKNFLITGDSEKVEIKVLLKLMERGNYIKI